VSRVEPPAPERGRHPAQQPPTQAAVVPHGRDQGRRVDAVDVVPLARRPRQEAGHAGRDRRQPGDVLRGDDVVVPPFDPDDEWLD
jgi:hypothetical protein